MARDTRRVLPRHPVLHFLILTVLAVVMVAGAYAFKMYSDTKTAVDSTFQQVSGRKASANIKNRKPLTFLLLGTDTGALGRKNKGNSDTMIVVTINPKTKKTNMISIPRDTLANVQNGSSRDLQKVNSAYFVGNSTTAVKTVEDLLNISIDYYVTINMSGLSKIVDAVGGVDVTVPFSWSDTEHDGGTFTKGAAHLDGAKALQFARMRYKDPEGDYGRQKRQQMVIKAIMKKVLSADTISNYKSLLATLKGSLQMNLSFDDLVALGTNGGYRAALSNVKRGQLKGTGATIANGSYQVASTEELQRVSNLLRVGAGKSPETVSNALTHMNALNSGFDWTSGWNPTYTIYPEGY